MSSKLCLALLAVACLAWPQGAAAASFDCEGAKTPNEISICADATLSALDEQMALAYGYARKRSTPALERKLVSNQRAWLAKLAGCGGVVDCLAARYQERIAWLEEWQSAS